MRCRQHQQQQQQRSRGCATCIYYHLCRLRLRLRQRRLPRVPRPAQVGLASARLKCHQRKNKWQQFSINCICAKLSSILASAAHAACSMQHAAYSMWQVASPVGSSSSSIRCAPSRCWSSQTPLTLQLATITFSRPSLVCLVTSRARRGRLRRGEGSGEQREQCAGIRGQAPIAC